MIKLLHAADFHLDSAFSGLPPRLSAQRRREQRLALTQLVEAARGCDAVLLAGDLFDSAGVYRDTLDALRECFAAIDAPILIAPGNHDFVAPGSPYLTEDFGPNVHIFRSAGLERITLDGFHVYGAAFTSPEAPALGTFCAEDPKACNILLLHGDTQPGSPYRFIDPRLLAGSGVSYLALGHVHRCHTDGNGPVPYGWPGCLSGRGFDECGQKGVLRVTLDEGRCSTEFVPILTRRYEIVEADVSEGAMAAIRAVLPADTRNDCYRILLRGESDGLSLEDLRAALEPEFFSLQLVDKTVPKNALWTRCGEDTLRGSFLSRMKEEFDGADEERKRVIVRAVRLTLALMDGREVSE